MSEQPVVYNIDPRAEQTEAQAQYLLSAARQKHYATAEVEGMAREMFGETALIERLSRRDMSALIDRVLTGPRWVDPRQQRLGI